MDTNDLNTTVENNNGVVRVTNKDPECKEGLSPELAQIATKFELLLHLDMGTAKAVADKLLPDFPQYDVDGSGDSFILAKYIMSGQDENLLLATETVMSDLSSLPI